MKRIFLIVLLFCTFSSCLQASSPEVLDAAEAILTKAKEDYQKAYSGVLKQMHFGKAKGDFVKGENYWKKYAETFAHAQAGEETEGASAYLSEFMVFLAEKYEARTKELKDYEYFLKHRYTSEKKKWWMFGR